jgi:tripartite-type tricarboxylate transporter receptor subunit TctC
MRYHLPARRRWLENGLRAALGAALGGVVARTARAQEWPAKPIRIVVPFAPGGGADTLGRLVAIHFAEQFKQNVVVENRAGAGGAIGSELVSKAPPDGYTLVVSGIGSHVIAPAVSKTPYHPLSSFTHIALFGGPPAVLLVHNEVAAKSVREFVVLSQTTPGGLSWGSSGTGTHAHLIGELFRERSGANMVHISYKGGALAMTDVIGKQIPATLTALSSALPHLKAGRLRALATTSRQRLTELPDVPTFAEAGYPQLTAVTWFSLSGPPGMPASVVATLNAEVRQALHAARARERLQSEGIEPNDLDATAFTQFVRAELERWTPLAKSAHTTS